MANFPNGSDIFRDTFKKALVPRKAPVIVSVKVKGFFYLLRNKARRVLVKRVVNPSRPGFVGAYV
jgi:hypothetical protein